MGRFRLAKRVGVAWSPMQAHAIWPGTKTNRSPRPIQPASLLDRRPQPLFPVNNLHHCSGCIATECDSPQAKALHRCYDGDGRKFPLMEKNAEVRQCKSKQSGSTSFTSLRTRSRDLDAGIRSSRSSNSTTISRISSACSKSAARRTMNSPTTKRRSRLHVVPAPHLSSQANFELAPLTSCQVCMNSLTWDNADLYPCTDNGFNAERRPIVIRRRFRSLIVDAPEMPACCCFEIQAISGPSCTFNAIPRNVISRSVISLTRFFHLKGRL